MEESRGSCASTAGTGGVCGRWGGPVICVTHFFRCILAVVFYQQWSGVYVVLPSPSTGP